MVVDRFTKFAHFIPCSKAISRMETTNLFLTNIVREVSLACVARTGPSGALDRGEKMGDKVGDSILVKGLNIR